MPRWVKAFLAAFVGLLVLVAGLHLTGRGFGNHGIPMEHGAPAR